MGQHGSGSPRAPKTALGCNSLILAIHDRSRRGLFFKAALSSPNIEKCDQNWSAWVRVPLGSQNCPWLQQFNFGDLRQVLTCREEAFFSKLLCLARISSNVTKMVQHGSGSPRPPKTALGCKSSILAIPEWSGPVEKRPLFQRCSV